MKITREYLIKLLPQIILSIYLDNKKYNGTDFERAKIEIEATLKKWPIPKVIDYAKNQINPIVAEHFKSNAHNHAIH